MDSATVYLFDTSALLALLRGKQLGVYLNETFHLDEVLNRPIISIVTHGELWALAARNVWPEKKRNVLREMLNDLTTIDLNDPAIIESYVAVDQKNQAHPKGARQLSDNDKWIAATARAANACLLTTDQDFLHLHPDVCLVQYVDPKSRLPESPPGEQSALT